MGINMGGEGGKLFFKFSKLNDCIYIYFLFLPHESSSSSAYRKDGEFEGDHVEMKYEKE